MDDLQKNFVSHQAIHTYLTKYRGVTQDKQTDEDRIQKGLDTIQRLRAGRRAVFGVGDLVTTLIGYSITGVTDLPRGQTTAGGARGAGADRPERTVFVGFFAVWKYVSRPYSIGVPLGLALLGVAVTAWNTGIILTAVLA